jgi:hypothetical protein
MDGISTRNRQRPHEIYSPNQHFVALGAVVVLGMGVYLVSQKVLQTRKVNPSSSGINQFSYGPTAPEESFLSSLTKLVNEISQIGGASTSGSPISSILKSLFR